MRIHHVQIMIPRGEEEAALRFYRDGLGLTRIPKPADMPNPEGIWFALSPGQELHLGIQAGPEPAPNPRAHLALLCDALDPILDRLPADCPIKHANPIGSLNRVHVTDPFGNRLELMAPSGP